MHTPPNTDAIKEAGTGRGGWCGIAGNIGPLADQRKHSVKSLWMLLRVDMHTEVIAINVGFHFTM